MTLPINFDGIELSSDSPEKLSYYRTQTLRYLFNAPDNGHHILNFLDMGNEKNLAKLRGEPAENPHYTLPPVCILAAEDLVEGN